MTITTDMCLICNEEGRIKDMPFNFYAFGISFHGTVLAVGIKRDEFASLRSSFVPHVMAFMKGR